MLGKFEPILSVFSRHMHKIEAPVLGVSLSPRLKNILEVFLPEAHIRKAEPVKQFVHLLLFPALLKTPSKESRP